MVILADSTVFYTSLRLAIVGFVSKADALIRKIFDQITTKLVD